MLLCAVFALSVGVGSARAADANQALGLAAKALSANAPANSTWGVYNLTPTSLPRWRKCIANVRAGTGRCKLATVGDSTTAGLLSNGTSTNIRPNSYPYVMAKRLMYQGAQIATIDSTWGDAGAADSSSTLPTFDSRITFGSGWLTSGEPFSLGGHVPANATTTNTYSFAPAGSFDTIDIYYIQNTGLATFTVNVDGGATAATINSAGSISVQKATITVAAGTHTINIQRNGTGGTAFIIGIDAYLSTAPKVAVWNMGSCSSTSGNWAANTSAPWDPTQAIVTVAPDVAVINLGINDMRTGVSLATTIANIQTIITALAAHMDVVLTIPVPSQTSIIPQATQDAYRAALIGLATANSVPLIDLPARFVNYTTANSNGFMADQLHPDAQGYQDMATSVLSVLMNPGVAANDNFAPFWALKAAA